MINKDNWNQTKERFELFWSLENHDRPLFEITGIKEGFIPKKISKPDSLWQRWLDGEYVEKMARDKMEGTYYAYEAFPTYMPDLGPDILGAILGDDLIFHNETSYAAHTMKETEWGARSFAFDRTNIWHRRIHELTEYMVKEARGDYLVGLADYHPGCDALVSLRGPENLCCDLYDYAEEVKKAISEICNTFQTVLDENHSLLNRYQSGSTTWMHIWHPKLWYVTSCDFIGMISKEMFHKFVADELQAELNFLDASVFHLDGPAAINNHLDRILEFDALNGVQVCYGAGSGRATDWLGACKKIQQKGKIVHLTVAPEEIPAIVGTLKPEGLFLDVVRDPYNMLSKPFSQGEVQDIERMVRGLSKKILF